NEAIFVELKVGVEAGNLHHSRFCAEQLELADRESASRVLLERRFHLFKTVRRDEIVGVEHEEVLASGLLDAGVAGRAGSLMRLVENSHLGWHRSQNLDCLSIG